MKPKMNSYKHSSKSYRWTSNVNGGHIFKRTYSYHRSDSTFAVVLLCILVVSPFLIVRKIKKRKSFSNYKSFTERLEERQQYGLEKLQQTRQKLWNTIQNKRNGESDHHWIKRVKRYGFTPDGVHIKTGISYQPDMETEKTKMNIDIKSKLIELEGETFYTQRKIPFTYKFVSKNAICISERKAYNISIANFEKAIDINPTKPSEITNLVRGGSYVFGIIKDSRFH